VAWHYAHRVSTCGKGGGEAGSEKKVRGEASTRKVLQSPNPSKAFF